MKQEFDKVVEDKIEIVKQTQAESQRVYLGRLKPNRNHIMFELNLETRVLSRAEFRKNETVSFLDAMVGQVSINKEIDIKDGCYYVSAMNEENACKKLAKELK